MSTKTTFKRIALVAVASLGFGVLTSVAPASAAVTALAAGTSAPARVGVVSKTTITATHLTTDANYVAVAKITAAPTGSTAATATSSAAGAIDIVVVTGASNVSGNAYEASNGQVSATVANASSATSSRFVVSFKADVAGTYTILVSAGSATTYTPGDASIALTITTTGAPTSISMASVGQIVEGADYGARVSVSLKDANGNATVLGLNESLIVTQSADSATVLMGNLTPAANTAWSLSSANSYAIGSSTANVGGTYYVYFKAGTVAANATNVVTVTGSGLLSSTLTSNASVSVVNTSIPAFASTALALTSATGYTGTASAGYKTAAKSAHAFTVTLPATVTTAYSFAIDVQGTGASTSQYATSDTTAVDDTTEAFSITQALNTAALGTNVLTVTVQSSGTDSTNTITYEVPAAGTIAVQGASTVLSATGATNKFTVLVSDQFGNPVQYASVSVSISGRNTLASTSLGATDANGLISYSLLDKGTTGTKDTLSFVTGSVTAATATVNYGAVTVSTVTVSGGSKAETVAGSTITDIDAGDNGPDASAKSIKAVVKDASGNLLAGVPVTFTVDAGAIQKTAAIDYTTVYTGSDGSATTKVLGWVAGKQTITATAGGVSGTDYFTWAQTTAADARVLSGSVDGNIISYKVVDRFGNPVNGVAITLSRTGSGLFGNGASTQSITTDKTGTADASFTGNATVVAELATTTQAYDVAGEIAEEAVTAAVAGTTKGIGDTLAPAGVGKLELAVTLGTDAATSAANAASDAAAEAIDAANAATDAANLAAEAADAATVAAEEARDAADAATAAVEELATQVATLMAALKAQITTLANTVAKIAKKVKA